MILAWEIYNCFGPILGDTALVGLVGSTRFLLGQLRSLGIFEFGSLILESDSSSSRTKCLMRVGGWRVRWLDTYGYLRSRLAFKREGSFCSSSRSLSVILTFLLLGVKFVFPLTIEPRYCALIECSDWLREKLVRVGALRLV